jgi:hypothetical protein
MRGVSKKRGLSPDWISELVWNIESDDIEVSSDRTSEDEGDIPEETGVSDLQPDHPTSWSSVQQFDLNKCL